MSRGRLQPLKVVLLLFTIGVVITGGSQGLPPQTASGNLLWVLTIPDLDANAERVLPPPFLAPALGPDGTLYINAKDALFALTSDEGKFKWAVRAEASVFSTVAVGEDGAIYTASGDALLAFDPSGSPKWSFPLPGGLASLVYPLAIGADGTIYVSALGGCVNDACDARLFAINPNGTQRWSLRALANAIVIGRDGTIYVTGAILEEQMPISNCIPAECPTGLIALTAQGEVKWVASVLVNSFPVGPAIGADGTIYVPLENTAPAAGSYGIMGQLAAISASGEVQWVFNAPDLSYESSPPVIGADGTIYVILGESDEGHLYALTPTGQVKWSLQDHLICAPGFASSTTMAPAVGADGTIYVGTCANELLAINQDGSLKWRFQAPKEGLISGIVVAVLVGNGVVYFLSEQEHGDLTEDFVLYAVTSSSLGLANSPWPMFQHDPQHTGRASP